MSADILLVDYSYICHRNFFACQRLIKQTSINILRHILIEGILKYMDKYKPSEVIIALDAKVTWRKKFFQEYKAQRKEARQKQDVDWQEFYNFIDKVADELKEFFPFKVVRAELLEADDIIAYVVKNNPDKVKAVITSDSDYIQLLQYPKTILFDPLKNKEINKTPSEAKVLLQKKILMGDTSDNIPSVIKGIGEKTADKILLGDKLNKLQGYSLDELKELGDDTEFSKMICENLERNSKLIDLTRAPSSLIKALKKQLDEYGDLPDGSGIFSYFSHPTIKLRKLLEDLNRVMNLIQNIAGTKKPKNSASEIKEKASKSKNKWSTWAQETKEEFSSLFG